MLWKRGVGIIIGLSLVALATSSCRPSEDQRPSATIIETINRVDARPQPTDDWGLATAGLEIYAGGQVRTGPASYAQLQLLGDVVRLAAETIFTVKESIPSQERPVTWLFLQEGRLWAHLAPDRPHEFIVETSSAVAAVRDTRFSVMVSPDQTTLVSVAEGAVMVTAQGQSVRVVAGQQVSVKPGQPPPSPEPMSEAERQLWMVEGGMPEPTSLPPITTPTPVSQIVPTPAPTEQLTSTPTATLTPTPVPEEVRIPCVSDAAFVADVTVPDGAVFGPEARIDKVWRVQNSGSCPWDDGYGWVFMSGDQMGAPALQAVPATAVGASVDIVVTLYAPPIPGTYTGYWRMRSPSGEALGPTFRVQIVVPAPTEPAPRPLEAEYWLVPDRSSVDASLKECLTLSWHAKNVLEAYLDRVPLQGENGTLTDCPCDNRDDTPDTLAHTLSVVKPDGGTASETIRVSVSGSCPVGPGIDDFVGNWVNIDPDASGMTRLIIEKVDDELVTFHGYGSCVPADCDWGVIRVPFALPALVGVYSFDYKKTQIAVSLSGDQLLAEVFDDYTEADGRSDRTSKYILQKSR